MKKLVGIIYVFAFAFLVQGALVGNANAQTTYYSGNNSSSGHTVNTTSTGSGSGVSTSVMTDSVKALLEKIAKLQSEVTAAKTGIKEAIKEGLKEGMTDDDIKEIQELLASDPSLYPEGIKTGYFGSLTKDAVKRFQKKHGLAEDGEISGETRKIFNHYIGTRTGSSTPKGYLNRPDVVKNVQSRVCTGGTSYTGSWSRTVFCKGQHNASTTPSTGTNRPDSCGSSLIAWCGHGPYSSKGLDVKVTIVGGTTTVTFRISDMAYAVEAKSKIQSVVLEAVADKLNKDLDDVDARLIKEIKKKFTVALAKSMPSRLEKRAQSAITRAEATINRVAEDIEEADDDVDTDETVAALDDAEELLEDAIAKFNAKAYTEARSLARDAEDKADDAADLLDEAD